ncbi:MAG: cytochrome C oxidase subunit IV family protein [Porticoccaceae bacterium]|jgi:hypothetical protein|nr:cytochrome C oxidase subunit IV family protein [Porticoccaceae bacterium]
MTKPQLHPLLRDATTLAWLILVGTTALGWWLGFTSHNAQNGILFTTVGILISAFLKVWIVGFQFMELKHAPRWLRHGFDAWVVVMCSVLIVLCIR